MDPHPTPLPGKQRAVAAATAPAVKAPAPKPKSFAAVRAARMTKRSPTGSTNAALQSRPPRRVFGTIRSSNAPTEKPPPPSLHKPSKVAPPQKTAKVSPPPVQKPSKLSPPLVQKPSKLLPPNPVRVTKPSRPVAKPLKKAAPGADLEAKAKKRIHRVSFLEAAPVDLRSGEKVKACTTDAVGHTPLTAVKAVQKPAKVVAEETPFFTAQNCSSCTLDHLESATYWLAQISLAESVGKHWVAAAFFRLAFECQAQPIHRIQSELRSYMMRHGGAGTLTLLFNELFTAHGMPVNQPKFDTDDFERVDTSSATNEVDKNLDTAAPKEDECLEYDCGDDLIDVGAVIVDKHGENGMDQPSFERKLDESFEFDDCEAVVVNRVEEASFDLQKNVEMKIPCSSETVQSACKSSIGNLSPRGTIVVMDSSSGRLSWDSSLDKLSPSMRSSSAKRLSSGSPFDNKFPLSSKRLTSSCPSYKKSAFTRDLSSKLLSGSRSRGERNATAGAADHQSEGTKDVGSECPTLVDLVEPKGPVEDSASEIH